MCRFRCRSNERRVAAGSAAIMSLDTAGVARGLHCTSNTGAELVAAATVAGGFANTERTGGTTSS